MENIENNDTENNDYEKNQKRYDKWNTIDTITSIGATFLCIIPLLRTILEEFTDFEINFPFFYSGIFNWALLAVMVPYYIFMIISYHKTRKYLKLITNNDISDEDEDEQSEIEETQLENYEDSQADTGEDEPHDLENEK